MPEYRRAFLPGATFFFTAVTYGRRPIFADGAAIDLLRQAFRECRRFRPFVIEAIVVLPDHLHTIWTLPSGDSNFPTRWRHLKRTFTKLYSSKLRTPKRIDTRNDGRLEVWQPRYWERVVRDEEEFSALADYIHYNPVRHGLTKRPCDWKASSFRAWVKRGDYPLNWGASDDRTRIRLQTVERLTGELDS